MDSDSTNKHLKDLCQGVTSTLRIDNSEEIIISDSSEFDKFSMEKYVTRDYFSEVNQSQDILDKAKNYAKDGVGFLILAGTNGTGKTYLAECIYSAQNIYDTDYKQFITQSMLFIDWQKQISVWGATDYMLNLYLKYKILVIDDLGTRTPTDAFMDFLYCIIDYRYQHRKWLATVFTTNLTAKQMRSMFGDAFTSRACSGEVIKFEGKDRRIDRF